MSTFFKRPAVLGIDVLSPKVSGGYSDEMFLQNLGSNSGNILFSEGLYRSVKDAKRLTYHFDNHALDDCDVVVIAAANWLNASSDFGEIAARLEQTKLPIIICGIGLQQTNPHEYPELTEGTMRLLRLAESSQGAIFTRGDQSAAFLQKVLKLHCVVSTGCPSLLLARPALNGRPVPAKRRRFRLQGPKLGLHSTRHLWDRTAVGVQLKLYRQAMSSSSSLILQSELPEILALSGGLRGHESGKAAVAILERVYAKPFAKIQDYLQKKAIYHAQLEDWLGALGELDFCFGTRVHGTIAALLAGTPAVLMVHDGRTAELAERMNLPSIKASEVTQAGLGDPLQYFDQHAQDAFYQGIDDYREHYRNAFAAVGIALH